MDSATYIAFAAGVAVGLLVVAIIFVIALRRLRAGYEARMVQQTEELAEELAELRQERADDRETNRRLRRELALNTPDTLQVTRAERDRAIEELDKLHTELRQATSELAARDRSLREARLAIHDIRVQLERNRFELDDVSGEAAVEALAEAEEHAEDALAGVDAFGAVDAALAGDPAAADPQAHDGHPDDGDVVHGEAPGLPVGPAGAADGDGEGPEGSRFFADYPLGGASTG